MILGRPHDLIHSMGLLEGDIQLTPGQAQRLQISHAVHIKEKENMHGIHERAVLRDLTTRWPGGVVPYTISSEIRELSLYSIQLAV